MAEASREHGIEFTGDYLASPVRRIFDGGSMIRRHIEAPDCLRDFLSDRYEVFYGDGHLTCFKPREM